MGTICSQDREHSSEVLTDGKVRRRETVNQPLAKVISVLVLNPSALFDFKAACGDDESLRSLLDLLEAMA